MRQRMQRWRGFSAITGLMAACLVGIVLVREYKPDALPPELRPARPVAERIVEKPVEVVREVPSARAAQFVAVFQKDEQSPAFVMTIDTDKRTVTVRAALAGYDPAVISSATYGISLEPLGGSPTGQPTGPVMHAKLVQATP